jgi:hypothetical protein
MKYNAEFIATVALVQNNIGSHAAKIVFDKLFDVQTPASALTDSLNALVPGGVSLDIVRLANQRQGVPGTQGNAVPWIKEFRCLFGCGLKEAKDVHDFLRANPTVANA